MLMVAPWSLAMTLGLVVIRDIELRIVRPGMYLCVPLILWIATASTGVIDSLLTSGIASGAVMLCSRPDRIALIRVPTGSPPKQ